MTPLRMNLKLFYQCRSFSILYAAVLICSLVPFWLIPHGRNAGTGIYALSVTMLLFFIGLITAVVQITVSTKPFSFLLPDRDKVQRQIVFIIGGFAGFLCSFIYLAQTNLPIEPASLSAIAAAVIAAIGFYLLIVGLTFALMPKAQPTSFPLFMFLLFLIYTAIGVGFYATIHNLIFSHPFAVLIIAGSLIAAAWKMMANAGSALNFLGQTYRSPTNHSGHRKPVSAIAEKREHLFLSLMSGKSSRGLRRVIWGSIYTRLGSYPGYYWVLNAIILIAFIFPAGYGRVYFFLFVGYIGLIPLIAVPVNNSLLLAMGRFERLIACIVFALIELIIVMAIAIIAFGSLFLTGYFMPSPYRVPDMRLLYLPLILMPVYQAFFFSTVRKRYFLCGILFCVSIPLFFFFVFKGPVLSHSIALPLALLANIGLWGLLAHECYRRDLGISNR